VTDQFLGEIRMMGFNFPPAQWASANGTLMAIRQNAALFSLIGVTFGGDGTQTFQLPNLAARMWCAPGGGPGLTQRVQGEPFGAASVALTADNLAPHTHGVGVYQNGTRAAGPTPDAALSTSDQNSIYVNDTAGAKIPLAYTSIGGGNVPHENRQPLLAMNFSIALAGAFPSFG
jgi:microcystin-dependent protein